MMAELEIELRKIGIPFDKDGNRIRCFPHVINIAVKAGLKALTQSHPEMTIFEDIDEYFDSEFMYGNGVPPADSPALPNLPPELTNNPEYLDALKRDVVGLVRRYVTACRASGQRREQFEVILKEGNDTGGWGDANEQLRNVGLLKDVDTRWSAIFNMLDRFLETYLVSKKLIEINRDLSQHAFSDIEIKVASDIRRFLYVFHVVQELVSAEKTPTLSIVLPLYEKLITMLKLLRRALPELVHGIDASVAKLEEYLAISRGNRIYGLAMGEY
ncbi:hypothetical protein BJ912DRAFT_1114624 [Pholiota molesta]|nr:hypothetical protein BJ912DRAFT_1114624 [Pholiota molesta]